MPKLEEVLQEQLCYSNDKTADLQKEVDIIA
jgi:hypothetical protein